MADSSQNGARRRYVRPWEFEVPKELESRTSILESSSFNRRLGGQLNRNLKSPTAASAELRPAAELNSSQQGPAPTPPRVRPLAELNSGPRGLVPAPLAHPPLQVHPIGRMNIIPKNLAPAPRQVRRMGQLNPAQQSPAPMTGRVGVARNRVPARFELLPDPKSRWNRIGLSAVGQLAFLGLLLLSPMIFPQQMQTALRFDVPAPLRAGGFRVGFSASASAVSGSGTFFRLRTSVAYATPSRTRSTRTFTRLPTSDAASATQTSSPSTLPTAAPPSCRSISTSSTWISVSSAIGDAGARSASLPSESTTK